MDEDSFVQSQSQSQSQSQDHDQEQENVPFLAEESPPPEVAFTPTIPDSSESQPIEQSEQDNQPPQEDQSLLPKRPFDHHEAAHSPEKDTTTPNNEQSSSPPPSSAATIDQGDIFDNNKSNNDEAESANKRRRISYPGKSILKPSTLDNDGDSTMDHSTLEDPSQSTENAGTSLDLTESFSGTTEFLKRNQKSVGRRVSFAATARIRMFERDEKEDEHAKTTSFVEGLNPQISPDHPFTFESNKTPSQSKDDDETDDSNNDEAGNGDSEHNDDTMNSISSRNSHDQGEHEPRSEPTSTGSSDSEKERSFEVNVGHSDNTGSSGGAYSITDFLSSSSLGDFGSNPFDDSDAGPASSSDEDVTKEIFPPQKFMKRSSGVGIGFFPNHEQGHELGTAANVDGNTQEFDGDSRDHSMVNLENYREDSMEYRFQNHRSSLTGRQVSASASASGLAVDGEDTFDYIVLDHVAVATVSGNSSASQQVAGDLTDHSDGPRSQISEGDTLDMDITAPIGGILGLDLEQPPKSFQAVDENDTMMSEQDLTDGGKTQEHEPSPHPQTSFSSTSVTATATATVPPATTNHNQQSLLRSSIPSANTKSNTLLARIFGRSMSSDNLQKHRNSLIEGAASDNNNDPLSLDGGSNNSGNYSDSQQTIPSTPPRRTSFLRDNHASPGMELSRELGTPKKHASNVRASFNIFPEVIEKQLQNLESTKSTAPVFQAPHVSPETSNLVKRIARYSTGSYTGGDQYWGAEAKEGQPETLERVQYPRRVSDLSSAMEGVEMESVPVEESQSSMFQDDQDDEIQQQSAETQDGATTDDESFSELPPITLNKFLSLAGIQFMDHLVASTRRRTITHRSNIPDSPSKTVYKFVDFARATAAPAAQLHAHREGCKLLKEFEDASRKQVPELEKRINMRNPDCFHDLREGDAAQKDFIKKQFQLIKKFCTLDSAETLNELLRNLLEDQKESLEYHLAKLQADRATIKHTWTKIAHDKPKITSRYHELKRQLELARGRQSAFLECDKAQLEYLAENIDELGGQLRDFKLELADKKREESDMQVRVNQLKAIAENAESRIIVAEKTIKEFQYVGPEDLHRAKETLSIMQRIHLWKPLGPVPPGQQSLQRHGQDPPLQFVFDQSLKVTIDMAKIGKDPTSAVQVSMLEEEEADSLMTFDLSLTDTQRVNTVSALKPKKRKPLTEYVGLLKDYMTMIASHYKTGTTINKILTDISTFWSKINLIRREIELVRTHNVVDIVAGSEENLKELEKNKVSPPPAARIPPRQVPGSPPVTPPIVLLDIRVRFTGPIIGARRSARNRPQEDSGGGGGQRNGNQRHPLPPHEEPVKFYLWFTFTLKDLLSFPGPNSFSWRLEVVYGTM
ncbi:hypothetical protein BGZ83_011403, partial [Gryganskiella cystojenkinii]